MRSNLRSIISCRKWRRASTTNDWRNCGLSLTATQFLDGRAITWSGDRTFSDNQSFASESSELKSAESTKQKASDQIVIDDLTFAVSEKERQKIGVEHIADNLYTHEEPKSSVRDPTGSADLDSVEIRGEETINRPTDDSDSNSSSITSSSKIGDVAPSSSSSEDPASNLEDKLDRHSLQNFYQSNPYYADDSDKTDDSLGGNQVNENNESLLQVSPQDKNDQFLSKIGSHWVNIKGKIADSWQRLDVEDELRKKGLASLPKYRRRSLSGPESGAKKGENKPIITPVDLLARVDSATKQMNKVVTSMTSALTSASSSSTSSASEITKPSAAAAKLENVLNIPLDRLVKMQASTVEAINNLQDQVSSAEIVINLKKRLMKEEEENEETTRERQALEARKEFLKNRCFEKLYVGDYSAYEFKRGEISDHQRRVGEMGKEIGVKSFTSWGNKSILKRGEEEEGQAEILGSMSAQKFEGNWTGLQLMEEEAEDALINSRSSNKSKFEERLRKIFFAMRSNSENETELARLTLLLTKILRVNPKLRTLVYEEKMLPFLLRHLESSLPGSPKHSIFRETLSIVGHASPLPRRGVRILAIDGGGVRAVVSVLMLKKLQEECGGTPIQELFDYVVGVSTGSILAAMCAIYDCPLEDCEKMYRIISKEVFARTPLTGAPTLVMQHAYYDTEFWNDLLRRDCGQLEMSETARHASIPKVAIVSTAVNLSRMTPYLLKNYHLPLSAPSKLPGTTNVKVWEALRASSAAMGLFQECRLGSVVHWDGGLIANNPTALAVHEAKLLWPSEPLQCVISLGTGRYVADEDMLVKKNESTPLGVKIGKLIDGATDTEGVHATMQDFLPKASYFRFNPYMSENILLDETREEKVDQLMKDGEMYLRKNEAKIKAAAKRLVEPRRKWQRLEDKARTNMDKLL